MIKITNEVDGKKYELVPETRMCDGCALVSECSQSVRVHCRMFGTFNDKRVCESLNGIWKEVKDAD